MSASFSWIRKIAPHLQALDESPLFGNAPPFDWERLSSLAASRFAIPHLEISARAQQWRSSEDLSQGLGKHLVAMPLKVGPLEGSAFWIMSKEEIGKLVSWMLRKSSASKPVASEILAEGFYRFLILQTLDAASSLEPLCRLSLLLSEESPPPQTDAFCIDIEISFEKRSCWGRLAIDPELRRSWAEHFASFPAAASSAVKAIPLDLSVQVGKTRIPLDEWRDAKPGDFLLLDEGSYDPRKSQGIALCAYHSLPLFQVKVKHNKLDILEMESPMPSQDPFAGPADSFPTPAQPIGSIEQAPIQIAVELGRFQITLEKLMQLSPGNLIELPIHPDQGANLTVNGQIIGRGEIVHLGETLGVRILEKG